LDRQISNLQSEIDNIKNDLSLDFGEDKSFYPLKGECYKTETPEYTYELCPFDKVSQISKRGGGSTSLG
jgi:protein kinase C substrate 80K-H